MLKQTRTKRGSISEPVQSADRHTNTPKNDARCKVHKNEQGNAQVSLPSQRTEKQIQSRWNSVQRQAEVKKYKCTCPVCGQTPKYWKDLDLSCAVQELSKKYECTCPVCGQTHKYKKGSEPK